MIEYTVRKTEDGKTIERILTTRFAVERNAVFKALRKRDIKINGKRISENIVLSEHDQIIAYIKLKEGTEESDGAPYTVIYENSFLLIVNKRQGIPAVSDRNHELSLIALLNRDFHADYELCHRIDRNTGGLLLVSKSHDYTALLKDALNARCYEKRYRCIVFGDARSIVGIHSAWHFKDAARNQVYIYPEPKRHTKEIITEILCVHYDPKRNTSLLEIRLVTGRTHQIRAHLAFLGFPIIGDGKYGTNEINRKFSYRYQALWAYALIPQNIPDELKFLLPQQTISVEPAYV